VTLAPGEQARCHRCGTVLARGRRLGLEAPFVFALSGLLMAVPATLLPFISAGKFGDRRVSLLFTGVGALWDNGMRALSLLVLFCGGIGPIGLLMTLAVLLAPGWRRRDPAGTERRELTRLASFLQTWALPEVQVLAVIVALFKLGSLVNVEIGAGFWCYCGMTLLLILARRGFEMEHLPGGKAERRAEAAQ
jgi:paraquat-inducible protein A